LKKEAGYCAARTEYVWPTSTQSLTQFRLTRVGIRVQNAGHRLCLLTSLPPNPMHFAADYASVPSSDASAGFMLIHRCMISIVLIDAAPVLLWEER
jgi:hypothetical protein